MLGPVAAACLVNLGHGGRWPAWLKLQQGHPGCIARVHSQEALK